MVYAENSAYVNKPYCLIKVVKTEGPQALFIGLGPTIWRNCVWNTVYFGTMFWGKSKMMNLTGNLEKQSGFLNSLFTFISGFIGATFATCFNAPFDVVKSRFQSQLLVPGIQPKYRYTLQTLYLIYSQEGGLISCYKGFRPKVVRMGLGGAVAMTTFDLFQTIFQ